MKKANTISALALTLTLMAVLGTANATSLQLLANNTRNSFGTLNTQVFKTCEPAVENGCLNPAHTWVIANGVSGSDATWDWDGTTLTGSGTFWSTSFMGSNPHAAPLISDKTVGLVINTAAQTTTAASYQCFEGTFLGAVGANGCLDTATGTNSANDSSALYNVGGNANCVQRTLGGDDSSTGNPRGLTSAASTGSCNAVNGAYNLWTVVTDTTSSGGQLILSNGVGIAAPNTHFMTFAAVPAPPAAWLLGTSVVALVYRRLRRRRVT